MTDELKKLLKLIAVLLGPEGCPWDRAQTPRTLSDYMLEEAYELAFAIHNDHSEEVAEEMGDLLFLLLLIGSLYEEKRSFTMAEVLQKVRAKMIRRHPHVFGEVSVKDQEDIGKNWERIKRQEKKEALQKSVAGQESGFYSSLPRNLTPLLMAYRLHARAARLGFTWPDDKTVEGKLQEEWLEWKEACQAGDADGMEEEFGDLLFTLVESGRRKGIKANAALARANIKFLARFERMETLSNDKGLSLDRITLAEMDQLWDEAKKD